MGQYTAAGLCCLDCLSLSLLLTLIAASSGRTCCRHPAAGMSQSTTSSLAAPGRACSPPLHSCSMHIYSPQHP